MPIALTVHTTGDICSGHTWIIEDKAELARMISLIALGRAKHVERILTEAGLTTPPSSDRQSQAAIKMLTVPAESDPWHRDGWMFQIMSWIAARKSSPNSVLKTPQMILAHKGYDGLELILNKTGTAAKSLTIYEDKATEHPRSTIRKEVWPEFKSMESGDRDNVLISEIVALLDMHPHIDAESSAENIVWKQKRAYRVSVTIKASHNSHTGRERLFAGYENVARGRIVRRVANTFFVEDLRPWMDELAELARKQILASGSKSV